jgi:hypothetical protein
VNAGGVRIELGRRLVCRARHVGRGGRLNQAVEGLAGSFGPTSRRKGGYSSRISEA